MLQRLITRWEFRRQLRGLTAPPVATRLERDVVVVPCWRRPEMLWHCLDNLKRAEGVNDCHLVFRLDTGFDADNIAVIESFAGDFASFEIQKAQLCPFRRTKLSANILFGYLWAANHARRYVYLIEEDIMVSRDFFRWHRSVHRQQPDLFCSVAVHNHNSKVDAPSDPHGYYLSTGDLCPWGLCFDRQVILQHIAPHVNMTYLSRPKRYVRRAFQASEVGAGFVEQASLIRRIQEGGNRQIAFATTPRAFHAGFYGKNRPGAIEGRLAERIQTLSGVIYDATAMRARALTAQYAMDSQPVALNTDCGGNVHQVMTGNQGGRYCSSGAALSFGK